VDRYTDDDLKHLGEEMELLHPRDILRWAMETFAPRLGMATAFGAEGCVLLHMLAGLRDELGKDLYIFNLDTGYQFPETLELRERFQEKYGLTIHLEIYAGTGDLAIKSFNGLRASAAAITNDPYLSALTLTAPESAGDKEKVSLALLAAGQLAAYLEGQTGLPSQSANRGPYVTAPQISINGNSGVTSEIIDRMLGIGEEAIKDEPTD
jgi:hypothetical protein